MLTNEDLYKSITSIYKYLATNGTTHRNVLRKDILSANKVSSKEKFAKILDRLISTNRVILKGENVSINPEILAYGVLERKNNDCYIVSSSFKKKQKIDSKLVSNYKTGDMLSLVIDDVNGAEKITIVGKSQKKVEVVEESAYEPQDVLGRVVKTSYNNLVFIPNQKNLPVRQIPILNDAEELPSYQDKICVMKVVNQDALGMGGYITEVKGDAGNLIHEYDAIAESHGATMSWLDDAVQEDIKKIPSKVDVFNLKLITEEEAQTSPAGKVVDLRHLPFTTVDPATCKDMDDAIYSTVDKDGNIVCYIAVANVTKYVKLNTEVGKRYVEGGFTIYAPNKAYNILPSELSTGICSLNPNEDRLAFVVKATIDPKNGKVISSNIYDSIINSHGKYSYEQAQEIVDKLEPTLSGKEIKEKVMSGEQLSLNEQMLLNYYAGQLIKVGFDRRQMIRFNYNKEREAVFDDSLQELVDIKLIPHLFYHEVIEAFMITANEATAKYAKDKKLDNIYRVHEEPNEKKTDRAYEFFNILGVKFDGDLSAEGTRNLIELIKNSASEEEVNNFLIKMQSRAVYSTHLYADRENDDEALYGQKISHYALQSPHYSHTTSPIRRVPDYITQFNILADIHGTNPLPRKLIEKIVEIANDRQYEVDQAERDFDDINSVMYCEKHIGEKMSGRITKIRYTSPEEGYEDNIVVIARNEERGICVEIPLSQILGRISDDFEISSQRCAVYDRKGNILLSLCKSVDFIIESADRKMMRVVGKTNKELVKDAEQREARWSPKNSVNYGAHNKQKDKRRNRVNQKKKHHHQEENE